MHNPKMQKTVHPQDRSLGYQENGAFVSNIPLLFQGVNSQLEAARIYVVSLYIVRELCKCSSELCGRIHAKSVIIWKHAIQ